MLDETREWTRHEAIFDFGFVVKNNCRICAFVIDLMYLIVSVKLSRNIIITKLYTMNSRNIAVGHKGK